MPRESAVVLGMRVDRTSYAEAVNEVLGWARGGRSAYACAANVHMVMEGFDSASFQQAVNAADLVTPDGVPLVWSLRLLGYRAATRVYGPDLTVATLRQAARDGVPVGFYGGSPEVLQTLLAKVREEYAGIEIAFAESPPFRALTPEEDHAAVERINASGVKVLFLGLGCPKQELWMAAHRGHVRAVMLGVGAAFDFLAGSKPQAPRWMMRSGLEWVFRFATEPRRLWRRYLKHNPRFVALFVRQLLGRRQPQAL